MIEEIKKLPVLYLVSPCYNEEAVLPLTYSLFENKIKELIKSKKIDKDSKVLFINDGSKDNTWEIIKRLSNNSKYIIGASLSRNRGHQNALLAGLMEAKDRCDITITLDCDGQHDIDAVNIFIDKYNEGNEIVYGVRNQRTGDSAFKKVCSEFYYKLINILGGEVITNHADYRLVSSKVLKEFQNYKEVNLFLRGLFPLVGFKSTTANYDQLDRQAGKSHYSLVKMFTLATDGITSLSIKPIRFITAFGILISLISSICLIINVITAEQLWIATSIICLLLGILFISLGIVGEYIGKIYLETKQRPRYIISERTYNK